MQQKCKNSCTIFSYFDVFFARSCRTPHRKIHENPLDKSQLLYYNKGVKAETGKSKSAKNLSESCRTVQDSRKSADRKSPLSRTTKTVYEPSIFSPPNDKRHGNGSGIHAAVYKRFRVSALSDRRMHVRYNSKKSGCGFISLRVNPLFLF